MKIKEKLDENFKSFKAKINLKDEIPPFYYVKELNLKNDIVESDWSKWEYGVGVYCFYDENEVLYIGMANNTFASRIKEHIDTTRYNEDSEWGKIIKRDNIWVKLYDFQKDYFWIPSAELYMIIKTKPVFNKVGNIKV